MLFAFGWSTGTYFVANGKKDKWNGLPPTLSSHLRENYYVLETIALGEHNTWFYKDAPRVGHTGPLHRVSPSVAVHYPRVNEICQSGVSVLWIAFGPDGKYVVKTASKTLTSESNMTRQDPDTGFRIPLRCASFGHNGAWVAVDQDDTVRSEGLSQVVMTALNAKPVKNVHLSPYSSTFNFIEYLDGTITYKLPPDCKESYIEVSKVLPIIYRPVTPGELTVKKRILFAFGAGGNQFFISQGSTAKWKGWASSVEDRLKRKGTIDAFSAGDNQSIFWKQGDSSWVSDGARYAYPTVWKFWQSGRKINWVAFGPNGQCVINTEDGVYASRIATMLRKNKDTGLYIPTRCASFGYGGSWVVVENDGTLRSWGLSESVLEKLKGKNVRNVQLSRTDPERFYAEFMDGTTASWIRKDWHEDVLTVQKASSAT